MGKIENDRTNQYYMAVCVLPIMKCVFQKRVPDIVSWLCV